MIIAFLKRHWWWIVPLIIADIFFFRWLWNRPQGMEREVPTAAEERVESEPALPPGLVYGYPTDQRHLYNTESLEVYQPTAAGRVESALYGSVRTVQSGGRLLPSFHAGLDIAALRRDRRGRPLDEIYAVTDGTVAYINPVAGNSNYGIYTVLVHPDPMGDIFTLYAHLARVRDGLRAGQKVRRGEVLGVMGNTSSGGGIPMHRAHLHFEIGMINNMRFHSWYRKQNQVPDHGTYHGHNLTAINPLAIYGDGGGEIEFRMLDYLRRKPPAFELVFRSSMPLDYFNRYPGLWEGPPYEGGAMTVTVSEGGVPLRGRSATPEEVGALGNARARVLSVDEDVLGRNGRRIIVRRGGRWHLGRNGERWLEIMTY